MFLKLVPAKRASLVLITLFHMILEDTMSALRLVSSNGKSIKLPPGVVQAWVGQKRLNSYILSLFCDVR
jgi:hypothetical protein